MTPPLRTPPPVRPTQPPGAGPSKVPVDWNSIIGKPDTLTDAGISGSGATPIEGTLALHKSAAAPLRLQRDEGAAGIYGVVELKRNGVTKGYLGLDANDHVVVLDKAGTKVLIDLDTDGTQNYAAQLHRDAVAGVLPFLALMRQAVLIGYLGADASDRLAFIATDGTTVLAWLTNTGQLETILRMKTPHLEASTDVKTPKVLDATGTQVVGAQSAAIANQVHCAGAAPTAAEYNALVDSFNTLLAQLRAGTGHGLFA